MRVERDFEDLFELFSKHEVEYCIVGAFAVAFHGKPRYTKDIDLLVNATSENARRVVAALDEFGFGSLDLTEADFLNPGMIVQLGREPIRVDLITSIEGLDFDEVWERRCKAAYGKAAVSFLGLDDLIKAKKLANRKQDQADLEILLEAKKRRQVS